VLPTTESRVLPAFPQTEDIMKQITKRDLKALLTLLNCAGFICRQRGSEVATLLIGHGTHPPQPAIRLLVDSNLLIIATRDRHQSGFGRYTGDLAELLETLVRHGHNIVPTELVMDVYSSNDLSLSGEIRLTVNPSGMSILGNSSVEALSVELEAADVLVNRLAEQDFADAAQLER
jgi:hypothetical protein